MRKRSLNSICYSIFLTYTKLLFDNRINGNSYISETLLYHIFVLIPSICPEQQEGIT